jgi:hypothetical protein
LKIGDSCLGGEEGGVLNIGDLTPGDIKVAADEPPEIEAP